MEPFVATSRVLLALYATGLFHHHLFEPADLGEDAGDLIGRLAIAMTSLAAITASLTPLRIAGIRTGRFAACLAMFVFAMCFFGEVAGSLRPQPFASLNVAEHAAVYILPLVFGIATWHLASGSHADERLVQRIIRIGIAGCLLTFVCQAVKTIFQSPDYVQLIADVCRRSISVTISQQSSAAHMITAGIFHLVACGLLLTTARLWALRYLYVAGFLSSAIHLAADRIANSLDETLITIPAAGLPLLTAMLVRDRPSDEVREI